MSKPITLHSGDGPAILNDRGQAMFAFGTSPPADGELGYATGCVFCDTNGGNDTALLVNEGDATSADFNIYVGPGLALAGGTLEDGANIAVGTTTGTKIGTAASQKLGFFNATPVVQPTAYTQTYATANKTLGAYTADAETSAYTGAADSEAKLADLNALRVAYENLRAFTEDAVQMLNSVIDDLQALGLLS